jgi:hypothetical protein
MGRRRKLKGVAHDIAHHAASGLSDLSPHVAKVIRKAGLETTTIEILHPSPYPTGVTEHGPLRLALRALHETTVSLLGKQGFAPADITSITLQATPAPSDESGYMLMTQTTIVTVTGQTYVSKWL